APDAVVVVTLPAFMPTAPPTTLFAPSPLTAPCDAELVRVPPSSSTATSPPRTLPVPAWTVWVAPVLTLLNVPLPLPAMPPARLLAPAVTFPDACESATLATPLSLLLVPTSPPATLFAPTVTLPNASARRIVPLLVPTSPPATTKVPFAAAITAPLANE